MLNLIDFLFTGAVWGFWLIFSGLVFFWIFRLGKKDARREAESDLKMSSMEDCEPGTWPC